MIKIKVVARCPVSGKALSWVFARVCKPSEGETLWLIGDVSMKVDLVSHDMKTEADVIVFGDVKDDEYRVLAIDGWQPYS